VCPVEVLEVLPVPGHADASAVSYAAILATPDSTGVASGTLWVNTASGAFHVRFVRRIAMGPPFTKQADPIVFALPAGAVPQNVFVDSLDDPQPGPCSIFNTWVPGYNAHLRDAVKRPIEMALQAAEPAVAATPIADPDRACRSGNSEPRTLIAEPPNAADIDIVPLQGGTILVKVRRAADSSIVSTSIEHSEAPLYNPRALKSARDSVFVTETVHCRPVAADYLFMVVFQ
jgi:hypothetical protein